MAKEKNPFLPPYEDPFKLFGDWYADAAKQEINDPNAMVLATIDKNNFPQARVVLLKKTIEDSFVFFTNTQSHKGNELNLNPVASLCFHWKSIQKQIRLVGEVKQVPDPIADEYFSTRPQGSQIGAWASMQSQPLESRETLAERIATLTKNFEKDTDIPRPPHWSGYAVTPLTMEFWSNGDSRLHERLIYQRERVTDDTWQANLLYP